MGPSQSSSGDIRAPQERPPAPATEPPATGRPSPTASAGVDAAATRPRGTLPLDHVLARAVRERAQHGGPLLQRYFDQSYWFSDWRQSDDMTVATEIQSPGTPNHEFYAKAGKAAAANTKLTAVGSDVELVQTTTTDKFKKGSTEVTLHKIEARNTTNATAGDTMRLWADCGKAAAAIVGSSSRRAVYVDQGVRAVANGSPTVMKTEIMKVWLRKERLRLQALGNHAEVAKITACETKGGARELELVPIGQRWTAAATDILKKAIAKEFVAKLDEAAEAYFEYYEAKSATDRDAIDKALKINAYVSPDVGQGFTTSSGGAGYAGKSTWNFHWGGVVMTSDDGNDKVVLENYSVSRPAEENTRWAFELYGTTTAAQSFHVRHRGTQQHGQAPTTMLIEKQ